MLNVTGTNIISPYVTAVKCPRVPSWADTVFNSTDREYGAAIRYRCDAGYAFPDNRSVKTAYCSSRMTWEPPIQECQGTWIMSDM